MTTMTREQRIARANEIFARVWPEESNSTLYDVADSTRIDLLDATDDLTRILARLRDDLIDIQKRIDFDSDEWTDLRDIIESSQGIKSIDFWVEHMRKLATQLESAIETQDVLDRAAS